MGWLRMLQGSQGLLGVVGVYCLELLHDFLFLCSERVDTILPEVHAREISRLQQLNFSAQHLHLAQCRLLNHLFLFEFETRFLQLFLSFLPYLLDVVLPRPLLMFQLLQLLLLIVNR